MTDTFDKLKGQLEAQGTLTDDAISQAEAEFGALTDEERIWLSSEIHDRTARKGDEITLEEYVAATQVLDSAAPDSDEYKKAQAIVDAFESAA